MNTKETVALLALLGGAVAAGAWWSLQRPARTSTPISPPAFEASSREFEAVELVPEGGSDDVKPAPDARREATAPLAPTEVSAAPPAPAPAPEEGSLAAITAMLTELQDAKSAEAEATVIQELLDRGERVASEFLDKERERRLEAGLYERIEDYVPGQTLTTTSSDPVSYSIEGSEARMIVYSSKDYPELYALRAELRSMRRALSRSAR